MSRITSIPVEQASGQTAQLYATIKRQLGGVPNLFQALGSNPQTLEAFLHLNAGLVTLSGADKAAIALTVAQGNGCDYCLAAHTALGKLQGLTDEEMLSARQGRSSDSKRNTLVSLVSEIVERKGNVADKTLQDFLAAGYKENQVPEVVLDVVQNIFTNYFNILNHTAVDFPAAPQL